MNKPLAITALVDAETLALVEAAARAHGSSIEDFAAEAIRAAAAHEAEFRAFVQEGLDDIEAGRVHDQAEMTAWFADRIAAAERRAAGSAGEMNAA